MPDVVTFGNVKFDFDAPSAPLTAAQQALFQRFKEAINRRDAAALMSLQDDSMKSCSVLREAILQDLKETIPDKVKVRFFAAPPGDIAKDMGFGDLAYLSAQPTAVLGITGSSFAQNTVKVVTILRPVRQVGKDFVFVPYCLTPKGKTVLEHKH